eukprot:2966517-Pyramimonas_sp.AAC.1
MGGEGEGGSPSPMRLAADGRRRSLLRLDGTRGGQSREARGHIPRGGANRARRNEDRGEEARPDEAKLLRAGSAALGSTHRHAREGGRRPNERAATHSQHRSVRGGHARGLP